MVAASASAPVRPDKTATNKVQDSVRSRLAFMLMPSTTSRPENTRSPSLGRAFRRLSAACRFAPKLTVTTDVRIGSKGPARDSCTAMTMTLFDHFVGAGDNGRRDIKAKRGGLLPHVRSAPNCDRSADIDLCWER